MKFKSAVINQMLSEKVIIPNSHLHVKMSSQYFHAKALMRGAHIGFTFAGKVTYFTGVSEAYGYKHRKHSGCTE